MKSKLVFPGILVAIFTLIGGIATAQEVTTGTIEGTVLTGDQQEVPGASVTLRSAQGQRTIMTDDKGRFRFPYLNPGLFDVKVEMEGYNSVERKALEVRLGSRVRLEITISLDGDQLMSQVTGQPAVPIFPESETKFFLKVVDAQLEFTLGEDGRATGLKLFQGGRVFPGTRAD